MPSNSARFPSSSGPASSTPTELEEPDFPYAGFTWAEIGIIGGLCVLLATISFLANFSSSCCAPETQAEMVRDAGMKLSIVLLWGVAALPIFWACVRLHPRTRGWDVSGWGILLGGHLLLAAVVPYLVDVGIHAVRAGLVALWPPPDPPENPFHPIEILTDLEFVNLLVPYSILLMIGMGRYEYLRSRARQKQADKIKREAEQLRSQLTEARLESLRMQINPHFFHNTLHTISTMAGRDPEGIRRATARLSDLMRYVLSTSDQQEVTMDEELDVLESYLDIQKLRLDDRLDVTFDIEPTARTALVPTLLLQPLAENAVKHGFEGADETGHLVVRAARDNDVLVLEVVDDGSGLSENGASPAEGGRASDPTDEEEGVGLSNIAERLDGLYGDAASLDFEHARDGGLRVVIRLPFHTPESDQSLRASGVVAG
ncbi:MAG TPA: sensor histidine kinase [Salinibacter sp.]|nr:sensor histidine kinase [Salinibacter sp.]